MLLLTDTQRDEIIETVENIISEDFTSRPGWNWPVNSSQRLVFRTQSPDNEGDIEIHIFVKRTSSDCDPD